MPAVLDLVEIGFRKELDPQGWKMLQQMRRLTQSGALARIFYSTSGDAAGFVCVKNGQIIGNLSLRYASPRSQHGRMIGNVVVHPDYRGVGIGRALMEKGIEAARNQGAAWVGLEVRADNQIACQLYEHLGFRPVGTIEHMLRPEGLPWPQAQRPAPAWRVSKSHDNHQWRHLAGLMHAYDQRLILEVESREYLFGGFERRLNQWLSGQSERAWVYETDEGEVRMAIRLQTDRRFKFLIWELLLHPNCTEQETQEMMAQCLAGSRHFPTWPVVALVPEHRPLLQSLKATGFEIHRTLQQMILDL
ncbi:MAG: GNAT family N-acetyltransferase [Anaerolineae bacterium]|nr:GNAT family N-acetyltransferase [Anaerolineae bacterium]